MTILQGKPCGKIARCQNNKKLTYCPLLFLNKKNPNKKNPGILFSHSTLLNAIIFFSLVETGPVAQRIRARGYEPRCRGFKSLLAQNSSLRLRVSLVVLETTNSKMTTAALELLRELRIPIAKFIVKLWNFSIRVCGLYYYLFLYLRSHSIRQFFVYDLL